MSTALWKDVPTRTVDDGGTELAYRELEEGRERDEGWSLATAAYPGFDSHQRFTDRQIAVAVLELPAGPS
jgi:hypothetical protein